MANTQYDRNETRVLGTISEEERGCCCNLETRARREIHHYGYGRDSDYSSQTSDKCQPYMSQLPRLPSLSQMRSLHTKNFFDDGAFHRGRHEAVQDNHRSVRQVLPFSYGARPQQSSFWNRDQEEADEGVDDELSSIWETHASNASSRARYPAYATVSPAFSSLSVSSSRRSSSPFSPVEANCQGYICSWPQMHPQQPVRSSHRELFGHHEEVQETAPTSTSDCSAAPLRSIWETQERRRYMESPEPPPLPRQNSFSDNDSSGSQGESYPLPHQCAFRRHFSFFPSKQVMAPSRNVFEVDGVYGSVAQPLHDQTRQRGHRETSHRAMEPVGQEKNHQRHTSTIDEEEAHQCQNHTWGVSRGIVVTPLSHEPPIDQDTAAQKLQDDRNENGTEKNDKAARGNNGNHKQVVRSYLTNSVSSVVYLSSTQSTVKLRKRKQRTCKIEGCTRQVKKSGVCLTHGAKVTRPRCKVESCKKQAQNKGLCIAHGATVKRCIVEGCQNVRLKNSVCIKHGANVIRCKEIGCPRHAQRGGLCVRHGARIPRCRVPGCPTQARKKRLCSRHKNHYNGPQHRPAVDL